MKKYTRLSFVLLCFLFTGVTSRVVWECPEFDPGNPLGSCNLGNPIPSWGEDNIAVVPDPAGSRLNVLRIFYALGSCAKNPIDKGGTQFKAKPFGELDSATLEYDIMFSDNFDFVRGGKIPGFFGGSGSCSGGKQETICFSTRYMWRREGDGEMYAYIPNETGDWFCDLPNVQCNFDYGHSLGRGTFRFTPGQWHRLSQYVKLNTPGQSNGKVSIKFDGEQVFELNGLKFREDNSIRIDTFSFSTFFGGGTLDWASTADVFTYYKNIQVLV